jgi:hypothetical protein
MRRRETPVPEIAPLLAGVRRELETCEGLIANFSS